MGQRVNLAIVGATGLVGKELLEALERRDFPADEVRLFASMSSTGERVPFRDDELRVEALAAGFYRGLDVVFFTAHPLVSRDLAEEAAASGALVIDASGAFRQEPTVPLVVPEVNPEEVRRALWGKRIVASPSSAAIVLALMAAPLARRWGIRRMVVTTVYGTTAAGRLGFEEHQLQTIDIFNQKEILIEKFPRQTAFNLFPDVGGFVNDTDTAAERELMDELPRILGCRVPVAVTAVQAPVFCGLAAAVNVELAGKAALEEVREVLSEAPGVWLQDGGDLREYPDTLRAMEQDEIMIGRLRLDSTRRRSFQLWISADNLRKGAALNLVQIAELALSLQP